MNISGMSSVPTVDEEDGSRPFTEVLSPVTYGSQAHSTNATSSLAVDNEDDMGSCSSLNMSPGASSTNTGFWDMNYHEAAIFLEEGANNEKFDAHPRHPSDLPPYLLVHNTWYYGFDLTFSLVLLGLAITERPAVSGLDLPVGVHASLEVVALAVVGVGLVLKLRWIGWMSIMHHRRTMLKGVTLLVMVAETVVVLMRQSSHFRVTRALRPIFLVDTRACGHVRRLIRQILQSLPPIGDMLGLLLFFVSCYALLGYILFSGQANNLYFQTPGDSFVSMFVLLTTANFPDVMMPAYAKSKVNAVFFISYIATVLYVLMNLMLAVVYETFTSIEKEKFRKLLLHRRKACQHAFRLLTSKQAPNYVKFKQFHGLISFYSPRTSARDIVLIFRHLNVAGNGMLSQQEFLNIYDAVNLRWRRKEPLDPWCSNAWPPLRDLSRIARQVITWRYFDYVFYGLTIANGIAMVIRLLTPADSTALVAWNFSALWDTYLFATAFAMEAVIRIFALGWSEYLSSGWNCFDFTVTWLTMVGALGISLYPSLTLVVIIRPLCLLRLFKLKKRYRDIFGTLVLLTPLMWSTAVVMILMYYFFAIIGMELFSDYDLRNCCVNTTVEDFYKYSTNSSSPLAYYYLNNFSNLMSSVVTLFELTVVNNWFIVMDAYASVSNLWSRLYFMAFYLFTMVVLTIVVASVLEAFRFRIQYKQQTSKRDEEKMLQEVVALDWDYVHKYVTSDPKQMCDLHPHTEANFIGRRRRTREVLQRHMYCTEIEHWLRELEQREGIDSGHDFVPGVV